MSALAAIQENDYDSQIASCHARIEKLRGEISKLQAEQQEVDRELAEVAEERRRYEALGNVLDSLEKLAAAGGSSLFWSGLISEDNIDAHLAKVRDQVGFVERRVKKITDKQTAIQKNIKDKQEEIGANAYEADQLRLRQEEAKNEYVIERQIIKLPYRIVVMPWATQGQDEKKFRKILIIVVSICLLLGWLSTIYVVPIPDRPPVVEIPERLAKLVKKEKPKPKIEQPKPEEKPPEEKKPEAKQEKEAIREKVKNKGVLAFKNNFADLLNDDSLNKLNANVNLSNAGSTAKRNQRSILTAQATAGSGGINSSTLSRSVAGTGQQIGAVGFSRVESAIGTAAGEDRPLSDGPGPSRTDEEIQIVFDKYKAALYRIYNRELRTNPTLQGKVVLRLTIASDGSVSACKVESTDMNAKALLDEIVERVKKFSFGAKPGVPPTTILYPIDFLPAS